MWNILLIDESHVALLGMQEHPPPKKIVLWAKTAHQPTFSCFLMTLMSG